MKSSSKFITLEGIEGSGKSTNLQAINKVLKQNHIKSIYTREPGGSLIGEKLREILLDVEAVLSNEVELLLMLADRKDHVDKVILPNLKKGLWVISDRYMDSSLAYQGGGREMDIEELLLISSPMNLPAPDLTLLFDLPVELAIKRMKVRGSLDRFEKEEYEFHKKVRNSYLDLAKQFPERIKIIDSSKKIEEVTLEVENLVLQLVNQ